MVYLYPLWLFFSAFFFYFAYVHWRQSSEDIRPFKVREAEPNPESGDSPSTISQANMRFAKDFNLYMDGVNKHNRSRHRAAALGYFISGVVSMISMGMLLFVR